MFLSHCSYVGKETAFAERRSGSPKPGLYMSFLDWLALNVKRDDSVGEIAKKLLESKSYPVYVFDIYSVHDEMVRRIGGTQDDLRALRRAWREYTVRYRD